MISAVASQQKYVLKVILVGTSGVGKTTLITKYFRNPIEDQTLPTVAPGSCTSNVQVNPNVNVELQIWDTAGQERFQSISQMFYRGCQIAIVCYDSSSLDTVEFWTKRVLAEVPSCLIFLVRTKIDMLSSEEMDTVQVKEIEKLKSVNAKYHFFTSSVTGAGIDDVFMSAARCYEDFYSSQEITVKIEPNLLEKASQEKTNSNCC